MHFSKKNLKKSCFFFLLNEIELLKGRKIKEPGSCNAICLVKMGMKMVTLYQLSGAPTDNIPFN